MTLSWRQLMKKRQLSFDVQETFSFCFYFLLACGLYLRLQVYVACGEGGGCACGWMGERLTHQLASDW